MLGVKIQVQKWRKWSLQECLLHPHIRCFRFAVDHSRICIAKNNKKIHKWDYIIHKCLITCIFKNNNILWTIFYASRFISTSSLLRLTPVVFHLASILDSLEELRVNKKQNKTLLPQTHLDQLISISEEVYIIKKKKISWGYSNV